MQEKRARLAGGLGSRQVGAGASVAGSTGQKCCWKTAFWLQGHGLGRTENVWLRGEESLEGLAGSVQAGQRGSGIGTARPGWEWEGDWYMQGQGGKRSTCRGRIWKHGWRTITLAAQRKGVHLGGSAGGAAVRLGAWIARKHAGGRLPGRWQARRLAKQTEVIQCKVPWSRSTGGLPTRATTSRSTAAGRCAGRTEARCCSAHLHSGTMSRGSDGSAQGDCLVRH